MIAIDRTEKNKWKLFISNEEWEYPSRKTAQEMFESLLDIKEKLGNKNDKNTE